MSYDAAMSCFTDFLTTRTNKIPVEYYTELIYRICSFNLAQILHKLSWIYVAPKLRKKADELFVEWLLPGINNA